MQDPYVARTSKTNLRGGPARMHILDNPPKGRFHMPKRRVQPGDRHSLPATAVRLPPELVIASKRRALDESESLGRIVTMREVWQRAVESYLKTPLPR
jgi:hypothetical protein